MNPDAFRGLIVSCQARPDNPLHGPAFMAAMARAAAAGGAVGLRANGPDDIRAIKQAVDLPLIGLYKLEREGSDVYITPDLESAVAVAEAGADVVAVDATHRERPGGPTSDFIKAVQEATGLPVFADVATLGEGVTAARAGARFVATTLAGYTAYSSERDGPAFDLLPELVRALDVPVIAEGRFWTPDEVARAFELGAHGVVVGTAITNPREITRRFAAAAAEAIRAGTEEAREA